MRRRFWWLVCNGLYAIHVRLYRVDRRRLGRWSGRCYFWTWRRWHAWVSREEAADGGTAD
jgi:hypothetical protein